MVEDGLSRKTANQRIDRVKRMFKWGAASELIPAGIPQALSMVEGLKRGRSEARETAPVRPVEDTVVEATLPHLPEVVGDMVRLQRLTGMRPAELCMIRPLDLDRSADVWTYRPESHKTQHHGKERIVYIGPQAQGVLLRYLARDAAAYCFRPVDSEAKRLAARHAARRTPLSCGNKPGTNRKAKPKRKAGDGYGVNAYRRAIYRGCDLAFPHPELSALKESQLSEKQLAELRAVAGRSSVGTEPIAAHGRYGNSQGVRIGSRANCPGTFAGEHYAGVRRARYGEGYRGGAADRLDSQLPDARSNCPRRIGRLL